MCISSQVDDRKESHMYVQYYPCILQNPAVLDIVTNQGILWGKTDSLTVG